MGHKLHVEKMLSFCSINIKRKLKSQQCTRHGAVWKGREKKSRAIHINHGKLYEKQSLYTDTPNHLLQSSTFVRKGAAHDKKNYNTQTQ